MKKMLWVLMVIGFTYCTKTENHSKENRPAPPPPVAMPADESVPPIPPPPPPVPAEGKNG